MAQYIKKLNSGGTTSTKPTFNYMGKNIDLDQFKYSLGQNYTNYINNESNHISSKDLQQFKDGYTQFIKELDSGNIEGIDYDGSLKIKDKKNTQLIDMPGAPYAVNFAGKVAQAAANAQDEQPKKSFTNTTISEKIRQDLFGGSDSPDFQTWFDRDTVKNGARETKNRVKALSDVINNINLDEYDTTSDDLGGIESVKSKLENLKKNLNNGVLNNDDYVAAQQLGINLRPLLDTTVEQPTQPQQQPQYTDQGAIVEAPEGMQRDADGKLYTKISHAPIYQDQQTGQYYAKDNNGNRVFYNPDKGQWVNKTPYTATTAAVTVKKQQVVKPTVRVWDHQTRQWNNRTLLTDKRGKQFYWKADPTNPKIQHAYYDNGNGYFKRDFAYEKQLQEDAETAKQQQLNNRQLTTLTPSDYERMGAVAADIGGLISSFALGYGTLGAGITGIASTALNTVADFTDPSMTKGEAWKNLGINAGLSVAGMFPGGNSLKIIKGLIRTIPTAFVALNAYNVVVSPEIRKSLVKGLDAAKKGDISVLTAGDLKNIVYALQTAAGAAGTAHQAINNQRFKSAFDGNKSNKVTVEALDANNKSTKVELTREQAENIHNIGKTKGQKAAQEEFEKVSGNKDLKLNSNYRTGKLKILNNKSKNKIKVENIVSNERLKALESKYGKPSSKGIAKLTDFNIYKYFRNAQGPNIPFKQKFNDFMDPAGKILREQAENAPKPENSVEVPKNQSAETPAAEEPTASKVEEPTVEQPKTEGPILTWETPKEPVKTEETPKTNKQENPVKQAEKKAYKTLKDLQRKKKEATKAQKNVDEVVVNSTKKFTKKSTKKSTKQTENGGRLEFVLSLHKQGGILKAATGVRIPLNKRVNSLDYIKDSSFYTNIFNPNLIQFLKGYTNSTNKEAYINSANSLQDQFAALNNNPELSNNYKRPKYNPQVAEYQRNFKNSNEFDWNLAGINENYYKRYTNFITNSITKDGKQNGYMPDGLFGATTKDRTIFGAQGYTGMAENLKYINEGLKNNNLELYLDEGKHVYKIRPLQAPTESGKVDAQPIPEKKENPFLGIVKKTLSNPNLLGLGRLIGDINATNARTKEYLAHYNPALIQPYNLYTQVHGDYGTKSYYENMANQLDSRAKHNISSDANVNNALAMESFLKGMDLRTKGVLADNQMIENTQNTSEKLAQNNIQVNNTVANTNTQSLVNNERERAGIEAYRSQGNQQNIDTWLGQIEADAKQNYWEKKHAQDDLFMEGLRRATDIDFNNDPQFQNLMNLTNQALKNNDTAKYNSLLKQAAEYKKNALADAQTKYYQGLANYYKVPFDTYKPAIISNITKSNKKGGVIDKADPTVVHARIKDNDRFIKEVLEIMKEQQKTYRNMKQSSFKTIKI